MNLQIIKLGLPLILSQGIQTIMLLTDRYLLSFKNPLYTAAATTSGFTALSLSLFFIHFLFFSTSLIAKKCGKNDSHACHIIVRQCFFIANCFAFFMLLLSYASDFYFSLLGHPADYRSVENSYFQILMFSQVFVVYRTIFESYFLGIDQSRKILIANVIGILANIPITYLFVLGPFADYFQGATGAAFGTLCANLLSLIFLWLLYYQTTDAKNYKISWQETFHGAEWKLLLTQGAFVGLDKFSNSFCFVSFVNMFVYYGEEVSVAVSIVFSLDQIAILPIIGMYGAVMSLFSRFIGQTNLKGAIQSLHAALRITFGLMLTLSFIFWTFATSLSSTFIGNTAAEMDLSIVYNYSTFFLQTTGLYIFANTALFLYKAALRSLGLSNWCFGVSFTVHILLVVSCYFGVYVFGLRPETIWGFFMSMLVILAISFIVKFYHTIKTPLGAYVGQV